MVYWWRQQGGLFAEHAGIVDEIVAAAKLVFEAAGVAVVPVVVAPAVVNSAAAVGELDSVLIASNHDHDHLDHRLLHFQYPLSWVVDVFFYAWTIYPFYRSLCHSTHMDMVSRPYVSFDVFSNGSSARRHVGMFRI